MHQAHLNAPVPARYGERLAGAFVLGVLTLACAFFWIGIPAAVLWVLGELTDSSTSHYVGALVAIPLAMAAFSPALLWLNRLYLRVTGVLRRLERDQIEAGWQRRVRGPLEPLLVICLALAVVALIVWFVLFAENPSAHFL